MSNVSIVWQGKTYALPVDMRAIREVERVTCRPQVRKDYIEHGVITQVDQAEIFTNLLNAAGVTPRVTTDDVYVVLFQGEGIEAQLAAMEVINAIMASHQPPRQNPPKPARQAKPKPAKAR